MDQIIRHQDKQNQHNIQQINLMLLLVTLYRYFPFLSISNTNYPLYDTYQKDPG